VINSIGNLGGFFGPWQIGLMKDATGSYSGGPYGLALLSLVSAVVCGRQRQPRPGRPATNQPTTCDEYRPFPIAHVLDCDSRGHDGLPTSEVNAPRLKAPVARRCGPTMAMTRLPT